MLSLNFQEVRRAGGLELLAKQMVEGFITGLHRSPYHGFSVEFAEHRLYNEGQSTRHIDWKVFARTDRLYTKQYEEETNLRCLIALDCSASMYYPRPEMQKIKFSIHCAAALSYLLSHQHDAVGLALFADQLEMITAIKSTPAHLDKIFNLLEDRLNQPPAAQPTNIAEVLHTLAEKIHKRSLVIIFSDMFENGDQLEVYKALQHLKHNKHEILLFHVTDHDTELNFDFEERPYEFIDLESGEKLKLNPVEIKEKFTNELKELHTQVKTKCDQLKIDFVPAHARKNYFEVLQAYLIKRSKMK
ncbi:MAG: hypothetical protein OJF59_000324 [Cytophagales bacterium]|jgi:uncharacterized protein (DUF58 family)|nr:DUF58 domain-containing protein [Bacteroidota bacterium]MBS1981188.1 DUF58 domain-containing protein [Bacteroidota bacterium]WHZ06571.1 MAG: hypothetical protein OJF59_000324 [Cytophagales bacterium]